MKRAILFAVVVAALLVSGSAWRLSPGLVRKVAASLAVATSFSQASLAGAIEIASPSSQIITTRVQSSSSDVPSFAEQIKEVQAKKSDEQKLRLQQQDQDFLAKELLMPEGNLVARGIITVLCDNTNPKIFPYGFDTADAIDLKFAEPSARLFLLAVGREGSLPLAAKSYPLKNLRFPMVFEIEAKDLLFPYTKDAWMASGNRLDTIAVSAFLTPESSLSTANPSIRVGFGLSDPQTMAGVLTRSTAQIKLGLGEPVDTRLFTAQEIELLQGVDNGIARNMSPKK